MAFFVLLRRIQPIGNLKTSQRKKPKPRVISNGLFLSSSIGSAYRNLKTRASQVYRRIFDSDKKQTKKTKANKSKLKTNKRTTKDNCGYFVLFSID